MNPTFRGHASRGRCVYVCVCVRARSPSNSYQNLVISPVSGTVPIMSLLFPSSQPLQSATWGSTGHCPSALARDSRLPQPAFPRLLCQLASCEAGPMGSAGTGLEGGGSQGSSADCCLLVFSSHRTTHSPVAQPHGDPHHDSATPGRNHPLLPVLLRPGVVVAHALARLPSHLL